MFTFMKISNCFVDMLKGNNNKTKLWEIGPTENRHWNLLRFRIATRKESSCTYYENKRNEQSVYLQSAPCYSFHVKVNTDSLKKNACGPPKD